MKYQFIINSRVYFSGSKKDAEKFIAYWDSPFSKVMTFKTSWKIKGIELAPKWVPIPVLIDDKIEYA